MTVGQFIYKNLIPATIGACCACGWACESAQRPPRLASGGAEHDPPTGPPILPRPGPLCAGNWIGGAFLVGVLSAGIHGSPGRRMSEAWLGAAERLRPAAARCCGAAGACCGGRRESIGNVEAHAQ